MLDNIAYPAFILDPVELGNLYKGVRSSFLLFIENVFSIEFCIVFCIALL